MWEKFFQFQKVRNEKFVMYLAHVDAKLYVKSKCLQSFEDILPILSVKAKKRGWTLLFHSRLSIKVSNFIVSVLIFFQEFGNSLLSSDYRHQMKSDKIGIGLNGLRVRLQTLNLIHLF